MSITQVSMTMLNVELEIEWLSDSDRSRQVLVNINFCCEEIYHTATNIGIFA